MIIFPAPLQDEIKQGKQLKQTKQKLKTPLRKEIEEGVKLRETKKKMATPLRKEIQAGVELKKTTEKVETPVETKPKRRMSSQGGSAVKKLKTPRNSLTEAGFKLKQKRLATPLRNDIHRRHSLRAVRRKSTTVGVAPQRKPTYAEILKRPKKVAVRRLSGKRVPVTKFGTKALPQQTTKVCLIYYYIRFMDYCKLYLDF